MTSVPKNKTERVQADPIDIDPSPGDELAQRMRDELRQRSKIQDVKLD